MYIALCTEDSCSYTAADFSQLPPLDLKRKRHWLICALCQAPAFFRKASRISVPCFGARHINGCDNASVNGELVKTGVGVDSSAISDVSNKIIVDFDDSVVKQSARTEIDELLPATRTGRSVGAESAHKRTTHRRLRSLLRNLLDSPAVFADSEQIIVIEGKGEFAVRDFFVPLLAVVREDRGMYGRFLYEGKFGGYWGKIVYTSPGNGGLVWLNSGEPGSDNLAIYFTNEIYDQLKSRYRFKDLASLRGTHILVLGEPKVTPGGVNCRIQNEQDIAMIL